MLAQKARQTDFVYDFSTPVLERNMLLLLKKIFLFVLILTAVVFLLLPSGETNSPTTHDEIARKEKEAIENAKKSEQKQNALALLLYETIRSGLRDPESMRISSLLVDPTASIACMEYRARNGFGGVNSELAVYSNGKINNDAKSWNKHCTVGLIDKSGALR